MQRRKVCLWTQYQSPCSVPRYTIYVSILQSGFHSRSFTFTFNFTFAKCFPWSVFYSWCSRSLQKLWRQSRSQQPQDQNQHWFWSLVPFFFEKDNSSKKKPQYHLKFCPNPKASCFSPGLVYIYHAISSVQPNFWRQISRYDHLVTHIVRTN